MIRKPPVRKAVKYQQTKEEAALLDEVMQHERDSYSWMSTLRQKFDEQESMLIVQLEDATSKGTSAKIFDPRLSTIVFERAARVMAQNPKGKAYAVSKDDVGKNMLMNLMLRYYEKNANEQYSHLIKLRLLDLYSLVYGSMFGIVPWRVNARNGYIGPELNIIPIRDARPQPGIKNINDADYFIQRHVVSVDWLLSQPRDQWMHVDELAAQMKAAKSEGDQQDAMNRTNSSYVERTYFPNKTGDVVFPQVELFTEYRSDKWVTWTPQMTSNKRSRPFVLRVVEDPYPDGMLPIVKKDAFPLLDSPIGLGEFERGKTLQYAINSLINLYMDGVKYSIFPPIAINPENVTPSSIKWGAGEKWFMNNPGADVQPLNLAPRGLETFQSTYGFLISALSNQSGSTDVSQSGSAAPTLGKTPDAVKFVAQRESARDEWDRFMMEDTITQIYSRWIALTAGKQEHEVELRLFKGEVDEIKEHHPDVVELFDSGRGRVTVDGTVFKGEDEKPTRFDYELETGSTMKPNIEGEQQNLTAILKAVIESPQIVESFAQNGQQIDIPELFKRWMIAGGVKDWDRIIKPVAPPPQAQVTPEQMMVPGGDPTATATPVDTLPQGVPTPPPPQVDLTQFKDPQIQALVAQVMGGRNGIPVSQ